MFIGIPPTCWYQNQNHFSSVVSLANWSAVTLIVLKQLLFLARHISLQTPLHSAIEKKIYYPNKCHETIRFWFHLPLKEEQKFLVSMAVLWSENEQVKKNCGKKIKISISLSRQSQIQWTYTSGHRWAKVCCCCKRNLVPSSVKGILSVYNHI